MNPRGKKLEPKLGLDMPFRELLGRLIQTDPKEVERSIKKSKQKAKPDEKLKRKKQSRKRAVE
jgi:hypothetical protein